MNLYPFANDAAKQVLLGFNEKVVHLASSRFYQRYKDAPPNLLMCVFRLMPGHSSGASRAGIPVHAGPPFRRMPGRGV